MKTMILEMVKQMVDDPSAVQVTEKHENDHDVFDIRVADADVGKVIGRNGVVANSIRTIVKVIATRQGRQAQIDVFSPRRSKSIGKGNDNGMDNSNGSA